MERLLQLFHQWPEPLPEHRLPLVGKVSHQPEAPGIAVFGNARHHDLAVALDGHAVI